MSLEITDIRVNKVQTNSKIVAFAKVIFNEALCVDGIKIIDGSRGLFIAMPSSKDKQGNYRDHAFPINAETRKIITDAILKVYNEKEEKTDNDPF